MLSYNKAFEFHLRNEARNLIFNQSRVQVRILNLCAKAEPDPDNYEFTFMMAKLNGRQCILEDYIQKLVGKEWAIPILLQLTKVDDEDCIYQQTFLIEHLVDLLELGNLHQTDELYSLVKRIRPSKSMLQRIICYMESTDLDLEILYLANMNQIQLSKHMYMRLLIQLQTQQGKKEILDFLIRFPGPIKQLPIISVLDELQDYFPIQVAQLQKLL